MKSLRRCAPLLAFCLTSTFVAAATLAEPDYGIEGVTTAGEKVVPLHFNGDLRFLPKAAPASAPRQRVYRPLLTIPQQKPTSSIPTKPDLRPTIAPSAPMPAPSQNFAGIGFNDVCSGGQCGSGWPPDTNGDVGPNHYIQAVNQAFGIYSKSGVKLAAFTDNQLWSAAGASPCNGNSQGDPIVIYDALADRWILTQFACLAHVPMHCGVEDQRPRCGWLVFLSAADGSRHVRKTAGGRAQRLREIWHLERLPLHGGERVHVPVRELCRHALRVVQSRRHVRRPAADVVARIQQQ
jgi:hypothetical protein